MIFIVLKSLSASALVIGIVFTRDVNRGQKSPVQILSQLFAEVFVRGFCPGWFFVRSPFCHNTSVTTLDFMFHMYVISCRCYILQMLYPAIGCLSSLYTKSLIHSCALFRSK